MVHSASGVVLLVGLMILGGFLGGLIVFIKLTGRLPGTSVKLMNGIYNAEEDERQGLSDGATTGFEDEPDSMQEEGVCLE